MGKHVEIYDIKLLILIPGDISKSRHLIKYSKSIIYIEHVSNYSLHR